MYIEANELCKITKNAFEACVSSLDTLETWCWLTCIAWDVMYRDSAAVCTACEVCSVTGIEKVVTVTRGRRHATCLKRLVLVACLPAAPLFRTFGTIWPSTGRKLKEEERKKTNKRRMTWMVIVGKWRNKQRQRLRQKNKKVKYI